MQSQEPVKYEDISVAEIEIGTEQVRHRIKEASIDELADSIEKLGLLNPITVSGPNHSGKYALIAGHRRLLLSGSHE